MTVADIMQTTVKTVTSDTPVSEVVVSLADAQGDVLRGLRFQLVDGSYVRQEQAS